MRSKKRSNEDDQLIEVVAEHLGIKDRIVELEQVIKQFLIKYDELEPVVADAFAFKNLHGMPYTGPNWSQELDELRRVVGSEVKNE